MSWSYSFLARSLFPEKKDVWIDDYKETVLERPMGGSGDSCVVTRLIVWTKNDDHKIKQQTSGRSRKRAKNGTKHTFIVKEVTGPSGRYVDTDALKTEIKRVSYKVEGWFLSALSSKDLPGCFISRCFYWEDTGKHKSILIEQDLVAEGFPYHYGELKAREAKLTMHWLARFHFSPLPLKGKVWVRGGYWSLEKRTEEYRKIRSRWIRGKRDALEEDPEQAQEFTKLDSDFAKRLEMSAFALDQILHSSATSFPLSKRDDQAAYDTVDSDHDDGRDDVRYRISQRVVDEMVVDLSRLKMKTSSLLPQHPFTSDILIHGDFKGENVFFSENDCAVCDFQWVGLGSPVMDIVSLVFSSLSPKIETMEFVNELLDEYCYATCRLLKRESTKDQDRRILQSMFEWALVDYSRYVVGSGQLYPNDGYFLFIAHRILARVDDGRPLASPNDYKRLIIQDISRYFERSDPLAEQ